ncbi:MAG: succinate dehydrogenase, cytochrome b556 subunit [Betaproteobacteria bacterium]|nr:succinate dehydrogenase, cytochrome b556 subunit [Betaproteobacteria bacterium]
MPKSRPKHLDLTKIRFPVMAIVSGMHRISGAVLFLFLPLLLWLWQESLASQQSFEAFRSVVSYPLMKVVLLGLFWGYLHHLCAGLRHLALDLHLGTELAAARASSMVVLVVSIGLTALVGGVLW